MFARCLLSDSKSYIYDVNHDANSWADQSDCRRIDRRLSRIPDDNLSNLWSLNTNEGVDRFQQSQRFQSVNRSHPHCYYASNRSRNLHLLNRRRLVQLPGFGHEPVLYFYRDHRVHSQLIDNYFAGFKLDFRFECNIRHHERTSYYPECSLQLRFYDYVCLH